MLVRHYARRMLHCANRSLKPYPGLTKKMIRLRADILQARQSGLERLTISAEDEHAEQKRYFRQTVHVTANAAGRFPVQLISRPART
jgi:hypothetical protein